MILSAAFFVLASTLFCAPAFADGELSTGFFVRQDSDKTTVVAPRIAISDRLNNDRTRIDASYSADIWTSASIDIRTAATSRVTEQRDQVTANASHEFENGVNLSGGYYMSHEGDYDSHAGSLSSSQRVAGGSATLEESVLAAYNITGRSGDPDFRQPSFMVGARFAYTQALSPETLMQGVVEARHKKGFQSSPYRFVGLGGDGQCGSTALLCTPERNPEERTLGAFVLQLRHALNEKVSTGLGYRFYLDDWGVLSHTATFQFAWLFGQESTLSFRYRFYTQSAADFYQAQYAFTEGPLSKVTRDRELSPMLSSRIALAYDTLFELDRTAGTLRFAAALGFTTFLYSNFVGLRDVYAADMNLALTLEL